MQRALCLLQAFCVERGLDNWFLDGHRIGVILYSERDRRHRHGSRVGSLANLERRKVARSRGESLHQRVECGLAPGARGPPHSLHRHAPAWSCKRCIGQPCKRASHGHAVHAGGDAARAPSPSLPRRTVRAVALPFLVTPCAPPHSTRRLSHSPMDAAAVHARSAGVSSTATR